MDKGKYLLTAAVLALLIMAPTEGFIPIGFNGLAAAAETGTKPPPGYRGWPPHYYQPGSPRYYHPWYPPYYEPEIPWYEDAPPPPAGR
ncbi:MAG: hypothetical protein ACNA74_09290, partial [Desulfurivibrio sp.]